MNDTQHSGKRQRNWKRILLLLVCAAMVGLAVYSFQAEKVAGNPLPMPLGFGAAVVLSDSMTPAFSTGGVVIVRQTETVSVGEVVVYQSGHSLVVHRVTAIDGDMITTKGDANNAADTPFPRSAVKGVAVFRVPCLGFAVQAIRTPIGVLLIMAAAILLLELSFQADRKQQQGEIERLKAEICSLQEEMKEKEKTGSKA